jgi:DNA polymerase-1
MFGVLPETEIVLTMDDAVRVVEHLASKPILAVDTETSGLSRTNDRAIILALSDGVRRFAVWPEAIPSFRGILEDPQKKLIMHNANFDQWMLLNVGIDTDRHTRRGHYRVYDTMVMHALLNDLAPHDLKSLAKEYVRITMVPFSSVFDRNEMRKSPNGGFLLRKEYQETTANYASLDAYATFKLFEALNEDLVGTSMSSGPYTSMWEYYTETELPFTKVLWWVERVGMAVNRAPLLVQGPVIEKRMLAIQRWFCRCLQTVAVNIRSMPQMTRLFFKQLGYEALEFTEKGSPALTKTVLTGWAQGGCPYATHLLEFRELDKKLGTYITNILTRIHTDGRVHATFKQTGARTGRLSCVDPNLTNQPPWIREAFEAAPGNKLLASDHAQLEMRVLGHQSGDPTLCGAIRGGDDVHSSTAASMFGVPYEDIVRARSEAAAGDELSEYAKDLLGRRVAAKAINFGLMYGQGAYKLAETLMCSVEEAKVLIRRYFSAMPDVTRYFDRTIANARDVGYCTTVLGRRRQIPGLRSSIHADVSQGERVAKNSPIQGSAADITKCGMIRLWEDEDLAAAGYKMVAQVHDEVVGEVPDPFVSDPEFNQRIEDALVQPFGPDFVLDVPLEVTSNYGNNWMECK